MNHYVIKQKNIGKKCKTIGCKYNARITGYCVICYSRVQRIKRLSKDV